MRVYLCSGFRCCSCCFESLSRVLSSHSDKESADYSDWLFAACYCILKSMALNWNQVRLWLRFEWWNQFISKFVLEVENE
nr:hypothetical protein PFHMJSLL_PFHMJSLL_CDS_0002 [Microvirus sp.]